METLRITAADVVEGNMTTEQESEAHRILQGQIDDIASTAVIRIGPERDPAVLKLAEEARSLRDYAIARVIATDVDLTPATQDLSIIAKVKRALAEKKADYLKPIKAHVDAVSAAFASITSPLDEADTITRTKVKDYRAAVEARRVEAEAINRQKADLAQREAAFSGTGETTVDTTPVPVPIPINHVRTDLGSAGTMKVKKWELVDFALVPDEFKALDAGKITRMVKAGGTLPGIKVWEEETIRVTA